LFVIERIYWLVTRGAARRIVQFDLAKFRFQRQNSYKEDKATRKRLPSLSHLQLVAIINMEANDSNSKRKISESINCDAIKDVQTRADIYLNGNRSSFPGVIGEVF
jgi:hypothetical protein